MKRLVIGIDECSWGSVAGPLYVGGAVADFDVIQASVGITDSKKYSSTMKLLEAASLVKECCIKTLVLTASAKDLVVEGYEVCRSSLFRRVASHLRFRMLPKRVEALIDGSSTCKVPNSKCFKGGDAIYRVIGAASIVAKAQQVKYMMELHKQYPEYGFDRHKGYLTALHWQRILEHGMIPSVHRARVIVTAFANKGQTARFREEDNV